VVRLAGAGRSGRTRLVGGSLHLSAAVRNSP
jgi:hypothetical protein